MEQYDKGEVRMVEAPPIFILNETGIEMKVNAGSKIRNLMGFAMKKMKEPTIKQMTWNGSGNAMNKAISCAEIMKRKIKGLHQISKVYYRRIEEYWEPKIEGLERLKVNRDIPAISILLSKEALDSTDLGYQAPGSYNAFWKSEEQNIDKPAKKYSYGRSGTGGDNFKKREKKRKNDFQKSQGEKQDNPKMKKDSQNLKVNQLSS
ncbi:ribonuclease P protein subunit p25-like protein [Mytilus californianus]|uniref:ribonuclease P protein subunit p25-like protein n=1 Tax=Mytilus californianus TaxID=6549 RepID=UPI002245DA0B|nr:ribonuclease P protein subunit p25-like protein [Mytilus californianus]